MRGVETFPGSHEPTPRTFSTVEPRLSTGVLPQSAPIKRYHDVMALMRATVTIQHPALGGVGTNTWHIRTSTGVPIIEADGNRLMGLIEDFYTANASLFPDTAAFQFNGELQGVGPEEGESSTIDDWTTVGAVAGGNMPPAVALCVGWKTLSGGRMGKGRTFLGPLATNVCAADGTPSATALGTARTAAQNLVAASLADGNGAVGIWSNGRAASGGNPAAPPAFRDIAATATRNVFASLRSRRD